MIVVTLRDEIAEDFKVVKHAEIVEVYPVRPEEDSQHETSTYSIEFHDYEISRPYVVLYRKDKDKEDHILSMIRFDLLQNFMME